MEPDPRQYLVNAYDKLSKSHLREESIQLLAVVIDIKLDNTSIQDVRNSLYLDIKRFISFYIRSKRVKDFGYEQIGTERLKEYLRCPCLSVEQQISLLTLTENLLNKSGYDSSWITPIIRKTRLKYAFKKNKVKYALLLSSWNIWSIFISILFMFFMECIVLLPAPFQWMVICDFEKQQICENETLNHLLNVITLHFDCVSNSASISFTSCGLIVLVVWSLLYMVVGVNFLFKNLFANFEIEEL
jgi:hypothetical protein